MLVEDIKIENFKSIFLTSLIACNKGSNHISFSSQWLSKNVNTSPFAMSAPLTLDLISPSLLSFLRTLTLGILSSSLPSAAGEGRDNLKYETKIL